MNKIEKIRTKIDRMLDDICEADGFVQKKDEPRYDALAEVLDFLDTLEEEPDKSLEEEVKRYYSDNFEYISSNQPTLSILTNIARHFAEWGAELLRDSTKMIDKSLEEAAEEYADKHGFRVPYDGTDNFYDDADVKASKEGFIAGAEWQEKRNEETIKTAEDHAFLAGADWQYQKIYGELHKIKAEAWGEGFNTHDQLVMKEAVEANVADLNGDIYNYCLEKGMTDEDKVKLIIVKED